MTKVLFLSQWYPNRYDSMEGLFVQKHAEAVSLYCDVKVLYLHADENVKSIEIEEIKHNNIDEYIVYYPINRKFILHRILKLLIFFKAYWIGYKYIKEKGFVPDIIHANILTRTGFIALCIYKLTGIPFVVTEHWSRYLKIRNTFNGCLRKLITRIVVKNAKAILPVSDNLRIAMLAHHLKNPNYFVVNNVVENFFFEKKTLINRNKKRILHVSCFDEAAKNVMGILRAAYKLSKIRQDFELILLGTGIDFEDVYKYAKKLAFQNGIVHFLGEKTPQEVANWMENSDFFVLFSNYENSPVVISESLASGKPIISTNVGGISEHVNDSNGLLVDAGDEKALIEKLNYMLDNFQNYNIDLIKEEARLKFSYENVGSQIVEIYKSFQK